mmetsp:Transcript_33248/g.87457  ORF Transcript_33248/g.87457 Transcript_33248/m.87457 type:complete len:461 (+) Transcript_33248:824-2206(+)
MLSYAYYYPDLKNEPYGMYWGAPAAADSFLEEPLYMKEDRWDVLASKVGSLVHDSCPRWLFFLQGVGACYKSGVQCEAPSTPNVDMDAIDFGIWWGENLMAAEAFPVDVGERREGVGKVVASPHTYGPSTHIQPQFNVTRHHNFPMNLPQIWTQLWGYLAASGSMPVVVGEFGGRGKEADGAFQSRLAAYLHQGQMGAFYWCLNPESADTGGLVTDWATMTPESDKLELIAFLHASYVPTAMERRRAQNLFRVSDPYGPPSPSGFGSTIPPPPPNPWLPLPSVSAPLLSLPPSPTSGTSAEYDWLFRDDNANGPLGDAASQYDWLFRESGVDMHAPNHEDHTQGAAVQTHHKISATGQVKPTSVALQKHSFPPFLSLAWDGSAGVVSLMPVALLASCVLLLKVWRRRIAGQGGSYRRARSNEGTLSQWDDSSTAGTTRFAIDFGEEDDSDTEGAMTVTRI